MRLYAAVDVRIILTLYVQYLGVIKLHIIIVHRQHAHRLVIFILQAITQGQYEQGLSTGTVIVGHGHLSKVRYKLLAQCRI